MEPQRDVYEPLNGLRGVAALCVTLFHAQSIMGQQLAPRGYLAVDLFFVLSGFVIAHVYERRFRRGLGAFKFFWLRVRRFYPLYLAGMLIGAVVMAADIAKPPGPLSWREFGTAVLVGAMFLPLPMKDLYPLNVPSWSLLCELLINLIYGLLWRWPVALAGMAVVAWVALLGRHIQSADLLTGMLRAGFSFPVGVFIYHWSPKLPKLPGWLIIIALAGVLLSPFPELLAITLAFPVGIALLAHCEDAPGFAPLGRLSFPLYAVHWPLLQLGRGLKAHVSLPPMVQGFFWIAIAVIAAWGVERFVDRYVRL